MRKTNLLQIVIFGLQRAAGPYRWANTDQSAAQQRCALFDYIVASVQQTEWDRKPERFGDLQVDH